MFTRLISCMAVGFSLTAFADDPCGPRLTPMDTIRLPEWNEDGSTTGRIMTLSTTKPEDATTFEVVVFYTLPEYGDQAVTLDMRGGIEWKNKKNVVNTLKYRQSVHVDDSLVPFIPPDSPVCWDPDAQRLITFFEQTLDPLETIEEDQISWDIELRKKNQVADINGDGIVDSADQGFIMAAWNTDDYRTDLNFDGIVNSSDLGILLSQWSESSSGE